MEDHQLHDLVFVADCAMLESLKDVAVLVSRVNYKFTYAYCPATLTRIGPTRVGPIHTCTDVRGRGMQFSPTVRQTLGLFACIHRLSGCDCAA